MAKKKVSPKTEWAREARAEAGERNLCVVCLSRKPAKNKVKCARCAKSSSEAISQLRETAAERNVCVECLSRAPVAREFRGRPVTRCQVCLDRAVVRRNAWLSRNSTL